jgi:hypothetical protein
MRAFATHRRWAAVLLLTGLLAVAAASGHAQVNPLWDHYKVYQSSPIPLSGMVVQLADQFITYQHDVLGMSMFATPVLKTHPGLAPQPGVNDPLLHYTWWTISPHPFYKEVEVENQFGSQQIQVNEPRWLLNPATKNDTTSPIPIANHYKCYDCIGNPVDQMVALEDQFIVRDAYVSYPRLLCNPTQKTTPDGTVYPVVDPDQHYVCYEIDQLPDIYHAMVADQFIPGWYVELGPDRYLCVPSLKHDPTPATESTWGRIKVLYR